METATAIALIMLGAVLAPCAVLAWQLIREAYTHVYVWWGRRKVWRELMRYVGEKWEEEVFGGLEPIDTSGLNRSGVAWER